MALNRIFNQIPNIFKAKKKGWAQWKFDETKGKNFFLFILNNTIFFNIYFYLQLY